MFDSFREKVGRAGSRLAGGVVFVGGFVKEAAVSVGGFVKDAVGVATEKVGDVVDTSRQAIANTISDHIIETATAGAYRRLATIHTSMVETIFWTNGLLVLSLPLVYLTQSPVAFYVAYVIVFAYSTWTTAKKWPQAKFFLQTMSLTHTIAISLRQAIDEEMGKRSGYEKAIIDLMAPDLDKVSMTVARVLLADVRMFAANAVLTLTMAFVTFRIFVVPSLEHHALW